MIARRRGAPVLRSRAGFTLVELVIVVMIAGVLMSVVAPSFDGPRFQLDAAGQEVAAAMAAARGKALLNQHDLVLTFDANEHHLFVLTDEDNDGEADAGEDLRMVELPPETRFGRGGAEAIRGVTGPLSFTKVSNGLPVLTFHRNGAASEEGLLYITSARAAGNNAYARDTRALVLERATGRVSCRSYRTGQWAEGC